MPSNKSNYKPILIAVSGGFDPLHIGHVRMFNEAKKLGDSLVVILNNDHWLRQKKGFVFMPQQERKEILEALRAVDRVVYSFHKPHPKDMSVARELLALKPQIFAQGGDRKKGNIPSKETVVCSQIDCQMVFGVGRGGKIQSSSSLVASVVKDGPCPCRSGKPYLKCGLLNTPEHKRLLKALLNF